MSGRPVYVDFAGYTENVPPSIPAAVQLATARLAGGRAARVAELPEWEELRQIASDIRAHTIQHMDAYLTKFEQNFTAAGGQIHFAATDKDACQIVTDIAKEHGVKTAVKSKSMATEEIGLNDALAKAGIQAIETDLGEYIIQLAGTGPSHILAPAVHLKKEEIADIFTEKLGVDAPPDPQQLTRIARETLRAEFLKADMGISGGNFLIAETGTLVMVTNEGNGRMVSTMPELQVAIVGFDKIIPDWESLTIFLKLLARSATGQKMSTYTQFITGPRRSDDEGGPKEFHIVIIDNGRSKILKDPVGRDVLKCIRCSACANNCPVYQNVGGFAYGWFISGPIGAIYTPQILDTQAARELPFASTLCGACGDVCPVKIPIPDILRHLRRRVAEGDEFAEPSMPASIRAAAGVTSFALSQAWLYRLGSKILLTVTSIIQPYPLTRWTKIRPLPAFSAKFRGWWKSRKDGAK
ncbi:MAG: iron-sulfur cluster-binding protein [Chloroflexi bacterium]|jgi:L-lactate dehydrogenase complex protein LldF|nr:iron-sulfur cluster-binding protein [Chloroflexota bacterium]